MSLRLALPILVLSLFALLALPVPGPARAADPPVEPVPLETALVELGVLQSKMKSSRSINEEIIEALEAVSNAYHHLESPTKPELKEIPEDASEEEREALEDENEKLEKAYQKELAKFDRGSAKFRKDAEKLFIKALRLQKHHRNSNTNTRDDVNIKAAQVLGETGNPDLAIGIQNVLEKTIFKAKYDVSTLFLDEVFAAIGKLGNLKSLEWMAKEFTHSNKSPRSVVDQLMSAHRAMVLFDREEVPGRLCHEIVGNCVKTYAGVEAQAQQSSTDKNVQAAKVFWDRIKNGAIKLTQYYSFEPRNEDDVVLATMGEFQVWFRKHKNPKRPPWKK